MMRLRSLCLSSHECRQVGFQLQSWSALLLLALACLIAKALTGSFTNVRDLATGCSPVALLNGEEVSLMQTSRASNILRQPAPLSSGSFTAQNIGRPEERREWRVLVPIDYTKDEQRAFCEDLQPAICLRLDTTPRQGSKSNLSLTVFASRLELLRALQAHPEVSIAELELKPVEPLDDDANSGSFVPTDLQTADGSMGYQPGGDEHIPELSSGIGLVDDHEEPWLPKEGTLSQADLLGPPTFDQGAAKFLDARTLGQGESSSSRSLAQSDIAQSDKDLQKSPSQPWEVAAASFGPPGALVVFFVDVIWDPLVQLLKGMWAGISTFFSRTAAKINTWTSQVKKINGKWVVVPSGLLNRMTSIILCFWIVDFLIIGLITQVPLGWLYGLTLGTIFGLGHILIWPDSFLPFANGIYLLTVAIFAQLYRIFLVYQFPQFRRPPGISQNRFTFGLLDGFMCDPDARICLTSCCCLPVRWADTATAARIDVGNWGEGGYWIKLLGISMLITFAMETYGITMLLALIWGVYTRNRIRKTYDLPNSSAATVCEDSAIWLCCAPCAVMQEAMQAEFVDTGSLTRPNSIDESRAASMRSTISSVNS